MVGLIEFERELKGLVARYVRGGVSCEDLGCALWEVERALDFWDGVNKVVPRAARVVPVVAEPRKHRGKAVRGARRWSAEEDKALATESGAGWKIGKMARVHRRSRKAVYVRLARLKRRFVSLRGVNGGKE